MLKAPLASLAVLLAPQIAWAQAAAPAVADRLAVAPGGYVPMKPTPGIGMPVNGGMGLQTQFSPLGHYARWFHDGPLLWICAVISVLVMGLLLFVVLRFNKRANPVPSKTSHNTLIEIVWTLVPTLILVGIAVPSIDLLAKQFKSPPANTLTIKATGNQWFWTYSYPDNGGFEVVSNMLPEEEAAADVPLSDIEGLATATVAVLESGGYRTLNDIIDLEREDLLKLPGIAPAEADRIMAIITELTEDGGDAAAPAEESGTAKAE